jgi:hypothetical protein
LRKEALFGKYLKSIIQFDKSLRKITPLKLVIPGLFEPWGEEKGLKY